MNNIVRIAAVAAALVFASTNSAEAVCKANYYNGEGHAKSWRQGVNNAHGDWSRKVRKIHGKSWSYWTNARVRDESCNTARGWPYDQWCNVEAYPCR